MTKVKTKEFLKLFRFFLNQEQEKLKNWDKSLKNEIDYFDLFKVNKRIELLEDALEKKDEQSVINYIRYIDSSVQNCFRDLELFSNGFQSGLRHNFGMKFLVAFAFIRNTRF